MMNWIYDLGFFVFAVFSLPHFLGRLRQAEEPRRLVRERFGFLSTDSSAVTAGRQNLWIHGVSVGEVLAVQKLIPLLLKRNPELNLVLTTVTPTGQKIAKAWEGERVQVHYFPFDFRSAVRRFFDAVRPIGLILVETEIWPNVIKEAHGRKVPVMVVNGRISERSFRSFRFFSPLFEPLFANIDRFLVQTETDRERLLALGVDSSKVAVTGNMKLDAFDLNGGIDSDPSTLRQQWGFLQEDQVLIGGSTHAGEEEILLRALARLRQEGLSVKLMLAPRHIERSPQILRHAERLGFETVLASQRQDSSFFEVLVLDELGVLRKLYAIADVVVMGGSFVRHGGQNPVEPALASRAIVHGPWVFNFHEIYRRIDEEGGGFKVNGEEELLFALRRLLASERERQRLGTRAYEVLRGLAGASERNLDEIAPLLEAAC